MNAARYREMIATFFLPNLEQMDIGNVWSNKMEPQHTQREGQWNF